MRLRSRTLAVFMITIKWFPVNTKTDISMHIRDQCLGNVPVIFIWDRDDPRTCVGKAVEYKTPFIIKGLTSCPSREENFRFCRRFLFLLLSFLCSTRMTPSEKYLEVRYDNLSKVPTRS